jgi:nitrite reductase/ring-hydroxylating ferredoxin subunit
MLKTKVKIASIGDIPPGSGKVVEAEGQTFAVFNVEGVYYAIENTCPHRGGPLGEGKLNRHVVTCPWHRHKFNVKTGEIVTLLNRPYAKTYPVTVEGSDVIVELG